MTPPRDMGAGPNVLLGTRIRERRMAQDRRQSDVARAVGISPAYLNLIEHNRRPVSAELLEKLAVELQITPEELSEGREEVRIAALREAAAHPVAGDSPPELDQLSEFLARYPGWSELLIAQSRRAASLERQLVDLSDRMTQDPYLLTTMHEVLSAVTSVRSTAAILVEDGDVAPEWRDRFHANLHQDSQRLSVTAQSLVAYLDGFEAEGTAASPQEEVEAWLADGADASIQLSSDAARQMAATIGVRLARDRQALPDQMLLDALGQGGDVVAMAALLDLAVDLVMRRIVDLQPEGFAGAGLLVCDASGVPVLRRAARGFALPRPGDSCALWPLFQALAAPNVALAHHVVTTEGRSFATVSHSTRRQPLGLHGPWLTEATMLMVPLDGPAPQDALPVGPACRICPRDDCVARREPSILAPQGPRRGL
ncbi:short-chain fatty acyl-CoA regulator family protein [Paracoccus sp. 1_MG-2023]|uniref:short-chain fatty acyl-CoA regulator family protein n=1 Tax=unclassified Paracoccus (in: a-proteobacteria) TaxID=2688777 RepID=UPI0026E36032|nr:short-chain fatty acyl-CoA regulator family protein [Paracoccus sp. 1_MG-2023]MDO6668536.1 short-chain fatty acyl-CoA regulator family protein [Paracoccus sp. 1_MG-2023]